MAIAPLILVAYGIGAYFFATPDDCALLTPVAISTATVSGMIEYFARKDRQLPVLDVGAFCALITLLYCAMPILAFIKSGYEWSSLSDLRLQEMKPGPDDESAKRYHYGGDGSGPQSPIATEDDEGGYRTEVAADRPWIVVRGGRCDCVARELERARGGSLGKNGWGEQRRP